MEQKPEYATSVRERPPDEDIERIRRHASLNAEIKQQRDSDVCKCSCAACQDAECDECSMEGCHDPKCENCPMNSDERLRSAMR